MERKDTGWWKEIMWYKIHIFLNQGTAVYFLNQKLEIFI
jgi:hypothetical protein